MSFVIMALVMLASIVIEVGITANPADASVCSDFPYSGQNGMRDSACRENTIDPGRYNTLTRADLTAGRANQLLNDEGFTDDWIWYAPKTTRTFVRGDGQEWSFCNTYDPTNADPDYFTTGGFVCDNGFPLGTSGDVMYSFASHLNSVTLDVLEFDNAFVSLTCGNFGTRNPRSPVVNISGEKFLDRNGNGTWESATEEARSGITFRLTRETSLFNDRPTGTTWTDTTDSNGRFEFNLANKGPGRYRIEEILPAGWTSTNSTVRYIDVQPGGGDQDYDAGDFGNIPLPPEVTVADHTLYEGDTIQIDSALVSYTSGYALSYDWTPDTKLDDGSALKPFFTGLDDAVDDLTLTVTDSTLR